MSLITLNKNLSRRYSADPFYALQTDMNKLFNHFGSDSPIKTNTMKHTNLNTHIDLKETKTEFVLSADLPGFSKDSIDLDYQENILTLKGSRKSEEVNDDDKYHHVERSFGSFERSFTLPEHLVDKDNINAKFESGVLTVKLAKKVDVQKPAQKITIN